MVTQADLFCLCLNHLKFVCERVVLLIPYLSLALILCSPMQLVLYSIKFYMFQGRNSRMTTAVIYQNSIMIILLNHYFIYSNNTKNVIK